MDINKFKEYNAWLQPGIHECEFSVDIEGAKDTEFATNELVHGLTRLGVEVNDSYGLDNSLQAEGDASNISVKYAYNASISPQGYSLMGEKSTVTITAPDAAGFLYGTYELLNALQLGTPLSSLDVISAPGVQRRAINHWDNMSGKVERGYSGNSLFFRDGRFYYDPERIRDYARLLASIGINEICINNVNVDEYSIKLITSELLPELVKIAEIFRPFCIKLLIAIDFESPVKLGGLKDADPLDKSVFSWWEEAADLVYSYIPDLAGFVVKADSEFRGGPASLGRTQADGANMLAAALKKHSGIVYWRCFVYNCTQDWRDTKTDRPKAAYDNFYPLDGTYHDNVILQVKNGPVDFQIREPISPLFGAMRHTALAAEFQVTQEYTGQQIDLCALAVLWEEFFKSPVRKDCSINDLIGNSIVSVTAVTNTGDDENWTGHLLAQANLFAFGRLAYNSKLTAQEILTQWVGLTFGISEHFAPLVKMLMDSRAVYEKYTTPLGLGWMVNINHHYGPSPEGYEFMKWGTYHRANAKEIGVDRTAEGTGYTAQYDPWLDNLFSNLSTCPEELLLFFHRLPYEYRLSGRKTLLQHIYDTHFEGVEDVNGFISTWQSLKEFLPSGAYESVCERLQRQLANAIEWCDVINTYFHRLTGIADEKGRKIYP